jgi:hypothetical protein
MLLTPLASAISIPSDSTVSISNGFPAIGRYLRRKCLKTCISTGGGLPWLQAARFIRSEAYSKENRMLEQNPMRWSLPITVLAKHSAAVRRGSGNGMFKHPARDYFLTFPIPLAVT